MTEKTEIKFEDLDIQVPVKIVVANKEYEHVLKKFDGSNVLVRPQYDIYVGKFGIGNPSVFILSNSHRKIKEGDNELYLAPIKKDLLELFNGAEPPYQVSKKMCDKALVEFAKTEKPLKKLIEKHQEEPIFFELSTGVPKEELLKLSAKQLQKAIVGFLTNGLKADNKIVMALKTGLLEPAPELLDTPRYMRYNDHKMVFTGTKTLKSTIAERVGQKFDRASPANLMGFATAETAITGALHGMTQSAYFDELQAEKNENIYSKLFSFLEAGKTRTNVGKASRICEGYPAICFIGNVKEGKISDILLAQHMLDAFLETLRKITDNTEAFSSRIAITLFQKCKSVEIDSTCELTSERFSQYRAIVQTLFQEIRNEFSMLYLDKTVTNWLNEGYDTDYKNQVNELAKETQEGTLRAYLEGHLEGSRHARGFALKLAVFDHVHNFLHNKVDVKQLIKTAESRFSEVKLVNLRSFANITNALDKEFLKRHYRGSFLNEPEHTKAVLYALAQMELTEAPQIILRAEIEAHIGDSNPYKPTSMSMPEMWNRLFKNQMQTSARLEMYGLTLTHIEGIEEAVEVRTLDALKEIRGVINDV